MKRTVVLLLCVFSFLGAVRAQQSEVIISLNEPFFDALLDALFRNGAPLKTKINRKDLTSENMVADEVMPRGIGARYGTFSTECDESITLLREIDGVKTAVRFRDGKIYSPIAFSGNYDAPFIGCVPFSGYAETLIDLEFDRTGQKLSGRARVTNVALSGTGGFGGGMVAKLVQGTIDKKVNPMEILTLDKLSFSFPLQNASPLKLRATSVNTEIANGLLNVKIGYKFE